MADTAALAKNRKLDAFHQHHKLREDLGFKPAPSPKLKAGRDYPAACQNQICCLVPINSKPADGKPVAEFPVSSRCRTQHSRLFNSTSANGIGKSAADTNPWDVAVTSTFYQPKGQSVEDNFESSARSDKVDETIKLVRKVLSDVRLENPRNGDGVNDHIKAAVLLRDQGKWLNTEKRLGAIPGVEVGDAFQCRAELRVIGLHCQLWRGIDYVKINGRTLATSVVDSGRHSKTDYPSSPDVFIYSGEGGNPSTQNIAKPEDQTLERGNLALENSMMMKNPIRVVRKVKNPWGSANKFVYQGLYKVEDYKLVTGKYGQLVYEFIFRRMKQPDRPQAQRTRGRKPEWLDISQGTEKKTPISGVNALVADKPCVLKDITKLMNPRSDGQSIRSSGSDGRSDSCKIKNPRSIPRVPSCKRFGSCLNRLSQHQFQHKRER
ncbi:histone-lysine N-methyltransferase, H3 lysine-9 specific SUVH5-like [Herrania umbratica]|uniref:Histone-lysine N-methyltransferase, H3 lysine-9 specific SUVH5-like n=1 Tax=Herrania umbratica TaxID=108875 RepID=A0A6J1BIN1_9ROSI|nr:histone-lysine N-methyltransferase, H3 lysine-9 specific SUVH5-like [Herrania umbratica]